MTRPTRRDASLFPRLRAVAHPVAVGLGSFAVAVALTGCGSEAQYRSSERQRLAREAVVQLQAGDPDAAIEALDTALGLSPDPGGPPPTHVDLLLMKADVLGRLGREDEANAAIDRAHGFEPLRTEVVVARAGRRLAEDDLQGALAILEEALSRNPENIELRLQAGLLHLRGDDFARAEALLHQAAELATAFRGDDERIPDATPAWLGLAVARGKVDPEAGVADFLRGTENGDPRAVPVLGELAQSGHAETVVALARLAAERRPADADVGRVNALILLASGQTGESLAEVERLLALPEPPPGDAKVDLLMIGAQAAQIGGGPREALPWVRRALDEAPTKVELLEGLAVLTLESGAAPDDMAAVKAAIERATLATEDEQLLDHLRALAKRVEELSRG